ncbi:MAG: AMP-binding protein [Desulfohalobiaceae bacterium]|nr:AMP-binding protein [Desulfohalobiaceae bacterium]
MPVHSHTFFDMLRRTASLHGGEVALRWDGGSLTHAEFFRETEALSAGLRDLGLAAGDRLAILGQNTYRFLTLFGAAARIGMILVPINRRLSWEEMSHILEDTSPAAIAADPEHGETARSLRREHSAVQGLIRLGPDMGEEGTAYEDLLSQQSPPGPQASGDDPFLIIHTAAVQGKPRGGVLTQHNMILNALQVMNEFALDPRDAYLNMLPLYHIMGINLATAVLLAGGRNVIQPSFEAQEAARLIREEEVSLLGTFPPMLSSLLSEFEAYGTEKLSLRCVLGIDQQETIEAFEQKTGCLFYAIYGQTETSGLLSMAPNRNKPGSAGRPLPLVNLAIVDEYDQEVAVGEKGEIVVRGPLVFREYWNQPEITQNIFREGWHHTGDMGKMDEQGYLFFMGRRAEKELIKSGGENVFPVEVEKAILEHPRVREVSVIGVPDPRFGEGIKAICVLEEGAEVEQKELSDFVAGRIAGYKKPRYITFASSLPKTEDGSIDRDEVKRLYGASDTS